MGNPRRANGSARNALRRRVASEGRPCWICGRAIDYTLADPVDPGYFVLDELVPVSRGGSPFLYDNVAPAHRACNAWRGVRSVDEVRRARDGNPSAEERVKPRHSRKW